jgi:phage terminase small subunit
MAAAIRAGYAKKSAKVIASELLAKPRIRARVDALLAKAEKRTLVTAEYVITSIKELADRCMQKIPVVDQDGNETGEWRFDSSGANRALENLGKHLKLFTDVLDINIVDHLADRLKEARERRQVLINQTTTASSGNLATNGGSH